jgi:hypothetical protein
MLPKLAESCKPKCTAPYEMYEVFGFDYFFFNLIIIYIRNVKAELQRKEKEIVKHGTLII